MFPIDDVGDRIPGCFLADPIGGRSKLEERRVGVKVELFRGLAHAAGRKVVSVGNAAALDEAPIEFVSPARWGYDGRSRDQERYSLADGTLDASA